MAWVMLFAHAVWAVFPQEQRTGEEPGTEAYQLPALTRASWALGAAFLSHALSSPLRLQMLALCIWPVSAVGAPPGSAVSPDPPLLELSRKMYGARSVPHRRPVWRPPGQVVGAALAFCLLPRFLS